MWKLKVGKIFQIGIARQAEKVFDESMVDKEGSFFIAQDGFEKDE